MENNSDRMGFALLAIVFISFLILGVNSTKNTTSNFFKDFSSWVTDSRDGNKNKDKYQTYYAYAWSADGEDRFTTNNMSESTVPNLVSPTDTTSIDGNGTTNQCVLVASLNNQTKTLQDLGFKAGDKLTVTADVMVQVGSAANPGGTFRIQYGNTPWGAGFSTTNINGKSATYHQSGIITITASNLTSAVKGVGLRLDNVPSTTTVTVSNVRFQNASGETIAPYVGKYSGLKNAKQSTNYKDYEWAYNGNYPIKQVDDVTHTAYSWSSDGTDRFTTTKPNLNLVDGTSEPFTMGYGIPNTVWNANKKRTEISLPTNISHGEVLPQSNALNYTVIPGSTYTQSIYVSTDAPLTGNAVQVTWFTPHNGHNVAGKTDMSNIDKNIYRITSTYTWPASSTDNYLRTFDIFNLTNVFDFTKGTFLYVYQPKIEEGSTATPYMPSASEVKASDQPKYIGTYTAKNETASQEPSDYTWKLNPDYHE